MKAMSGAGLLPHVGMAAVLLMWAATVPSAVCAQRLAVAPTDTTLDGYVEVLIEDSERGSRMLYFLVSGETRIPLRFAAPPTDLTTGTRVRVRGRWEPDGALAVTAIERLPEP